MVDQTINNLLDNITATNRDLVDQRLKDLTGQRKQLANRLDELDHLAISQTVITEMVNEAMQYKSGLEFTLRQGWLRRNWRHYGNELNESGSTNPKVVLI